MKLISVYKTASGTPWPGGFMASCYLADMQQSIGVADGFHAVYGFMDEKGSDWYFAEEDIQRVGPKVLTALLRDTGLVESCGQRYVRRMTRVAKSLDRRRVLARLAKMDDRSIAQLLRPAIKLYNDASYYVEPPNFSLELGGQHQVKDMLRSHLKQQGFALKPSDIDALFGLMSSFTRLSFSQRAEISLLKICLLPPAKREAAIVDHVKAFYWQVYDYYGPILTPQDVAEELKAYQHLTPADVRQRLQEIVQSVKMSAREQKAAEAKYRFTKELKSAFMILRDFGYLYSDVKKELTTKVNIALAEVLHHVAKRHGLDEYFVHFATVDEVLALLEKGQTIDDGVLEQRRKHSILKCLSAAEGHYCFISAAEEKVVRSSIVAPEIPLESLKGIPACSGKYRGKVRVIKNASQISKFGQGEVLVTPMTTVNYVPAMKKAGAIVTDLGGITCHAAIVSRELGIPCIIGTKVATQVFQDGDMVEINADHGLITKLT